MKRDQEHLKRSVGLARGTVRLADYNPKWPEIYEAEKRVIVNSLRVEPRIIQHVGSTSVPGLSAKPIVDIAMLADSLAWAETWQPKLEDIGYWYKGAVASMPEKRFFAKGPEDCRTVYLHVVEADEFDRLIRFRDYLIANEYAKIEYTNLKRMLVADHSDDRATYSRLKNDFIQRVLKESATQSAQAQR